MLQHISIDDLNQLSETGKEKLRAWCKEHEYIIIGNDIEDEYGYGWEEDFPLLSIGQMIEFLREQNSTVSIYINAGGLESVTWHSELGLCDALWEAVKKCLEKGS